MADNCRCCAYLEGMDGPNSQRRKLWRVLGTAILIAALFGILAAIGMARAAIGVVVMLLVGFALIALMFYSSSHGYDEREGHE